MTPVEPAEIWKKLTPSQRVTLLEETHPHLQYRDLYKFGNEALLRAGLMRRGRSTAEHASGSARHALGRKGLLEIGQTIALPTSAAGFHTPRRATDLGRLVADHGFALLTGGSAVAHATKTKKASVNQDAALAEVRRIMRSTGFDEESVSGTAIHFASRDEGDVLEGTPDPGVLRLARGKAKEIEAAVPGSRARVEVVDEWVSIDVTLPSARSKSRPLKVGDVVEVPDGLGGVATGTVSRITEGSRNPFQVRFESGVTLHYAPDQLKRVTTKKPSPRHSSPRAVAFAPTRSTPRIFQPGDEVKYTNFTIGGSHQGTAVVTWDHGKSVEARTLTGQKIRLERAADGSLRRFS